MNQVKEIIKTYLATNSLKATARRLRISKNTVKEYVRRGQLANSDLSTLLNLSEEDFLSVFYPNTDKTSNDRLSYFKTKVDKWIVELRRVGVTKHLLWEEYLKEHPDGFGYSRFCELLRNHIGQQNNNIEHTNE